MHWHGPAEGWSIWVVFGDRKEKPNERKPCLFDPSLLGSQQEIQQLEQRDGPTQGQEKGSVFSSRMNKIRVFNNENKPHFIMTSKENCSYLGIRG